MHRKQTSILLLVPPSFGPWPEIRTKYRTHVPSRNFQLHFCQSLAGLSNEGSVDQGDSSHSHQLVPIQNQSKTGLAHWYAVAYIHSGLYAWRPTASKMVHTFIKLVFAFLNWYWILYFGDETEQRIQNYEHHFMSYRGSINTSKR